MTTQALRTFLAKYGRRIDLAIGTIGIVVLSGFIIAAGLPYMIGAVLGAIILALVYLIYNDEQDES